MVTFLSFVPMRGSSFQETVLASSLRIPQNRSRTRRRENAMTDIQYRDRRRLLAAAAGSLLGGGNLLSIGARAAGRTKIDMQLGWLIGGNQLGEVVAKKQGYFEQEGIDFEIQPGGPNIDGVAVVASGRFGLG